MRPSMGSVGDAYDNAMCESFFATLECELLDRRRFKTQAEARMAAFEFIEGFYNRRRRHSSIGYLSPVEYERRYHEGTVDPDARERAIVLASPSGGPKMGPFLTPAAHDGRIVVRVGTEEWRRRGPNKRMDQRRTKCRQIGYPDPKSATVHQIGAGPQQGDTKRGWQNSTNDWRATLRSGSLCRKALGTCRSEIVMDSIGSRQWNGTKLNTSGRNCRPVRGGTGSI